MRRHRSTLGPILLITIGALFALDYIDGRWSFSQTWPVILVVIGIVKLVERMVWDDGYYGNGPRPWGPPWSHQATQQATNTPPGSTAYSGAVPPPPHAAPPPPPGATPEYPTYPTYPPASGGSSLSEHGLNQSGSKQPGDGHAS
jgi:hypothetical protein